jgi:hypothetical protein
VLTLRLDWDVQAFLLVSYCNLAEHLTATSRSLGGVITVELAAVTKTPMYVRRDSQLEAQG